jgi:hypothetical protein
MSLLKLNPVEPLSFALRRHDACAFPQIFLPATLL